MGVGYGSFGRALYHRIRFNSSSGARSYSAKFILLDSFEKTDCAVFFAFKSTCGVIAAQVMAECAFWKQLNIGFAPASYCVSGGRPRINSIVRSMLAQRRCLIVSRM